MMRLWCNWILVESVNGVRVRGKLDENFITNACCFALK